MPRRDVSNDPSDHAAGEDWEGNNVAFACPVCGKVFIVSGAATIHNGARKCPSCGKSSGHVDGGRKSDGHAWIEW